MADEQTIQKGRVAERILEDDVFQEALDMADERIIEEWRSAETTEERERAHAQQAALTVVVNQLRILADRARWEEDPGDS